MVWAWTVIRRSTKSPFIRIPKDVLRQMESQGKPQVLRVLVMSLEEEEKLKECMEGG